LKPEYASSSTSSFDIFAGHTGEGTMSGRVNEIITRKTEGRVRDFLTSKSDTADIIMGSIVYFSLLWKNPFNPANTEPRRFYYNGGSLPVSTMAGTFKSIPYYSSSADQFQYIELEYANSNMVMGILLPNLPPAGCTNAEYDERFFTAENIANAQTFVKPTVVNMTIPKFTFCQKMSLNDIIRSIGGDFLFDNIDVSNMVDSPARGPYHVMQITQGIVIEVSETKTEFTSAVTVEIRGRGSGPRTESFCADHRFYYHIYDKTTSVPIATGIFDHYLAV
jgi:serine protease inhibitor